MVIEVLYFEGCPNLGRTLELARSVAEELGVDADVLEVEVRDQEEAERLGFLGSPSVRVNGMDIEPGADARTEFAVSCRVYGNFGVPPKKFLVAAVKRCRTREQKVS